MNQCPRCGIELENSTHVYGEYPQCSQCHGVLISWILFKNNTNPEINRDLWAMALRDDNQKGTCKSCGLPLRVAQKNVEGNNAVINICKHCPSVWIDGENLEETARALPMKVQKKDTIPDEARAQLAIEMINAENRKNQSSETMPDGFQMKHLGLLLGPVEAGRSRNAKAPVFTYGVLAITIIVSLMILFSPQKEPLIYFLGFTPSNSLKLGGLTVLTSFFVHGNIMHLVGNMYFLWIFGKNVEQRLGWFIYLILIFASTVVGNGLHGMFAPDKTITCIGASGGVSGVLIFYCLAFYKERLLILFSAGFRLRDFFVPRIIPVPAIVLGLGWFVLQLLGSLIQVGGSSDVSYLAHIGGAIIGFTTWLVLRNDPERLQPYDDDLY